MSYVYILCNLIVLFLIIVKEYGDLRINGSGRAGKLQFQDDHGNWSSLCITGFNDYAGDVACKQLGYKRFTNFYALPDIK